MGEQARPNAGQYLARTATAGKRASERRIRNLSKIWGRASNPPSWADYISNAARGDTILCAEILVTNSDSNELASEAEDQVRTRYCRSDYLSARTSEGKLGRGRQICRYGVGCGKISLCPDFSANWKHGFSIFSFLPFRLKRG